MQISVGLPTLIIVGVIISYYFKRKEEERLRREEEHLRKEETLNNFKNQLEEHGLESIEVPNFVLGPTEVCYFSGEVKLRKILKTKYEMNQGTFYLTNNQIVFNSNSFKLGKNLKDIVYIDTEEIEKESIKLQIGKTWYEIIVKDAHIFELILKETINQYKSNNPKYSKKVVCVYCNTLNYIDNKSQQIKCSNCGGPLEHKRL